MPPFRAEKWTVYRNTRLFSGLRNSPSDAPLPVRSDVPLPLMSLGLFLKAEWGYRRLASTTQTSASGCQGAPS